MDAPEIRTKLEVMLTATGKCISLLPRDQRAGARRIMLKAFNLLSTKDASKDRLSGVLQRLVELFDRMQASCILDTITSPVLWGSTEWLDMVLIKPFRGFMLRPEYGLLTRPLEMLYDKAAAVLEEAEQAASMISAVNAEPEQGGRESFELVRGEDGNEPYRP